MKTKRINLRVTDETDALIRAKANSAGMTITDYIVKCATSKKIINFDGLKELTTQAEDMTNSTEQFNMDLETCMDQMEESAQKLLENTEKQVGRMSEQFSQALSQEKQRLRKHTTKLILISLIPSVLLIAWELIRHFYLST